MLAGQAREIARRWVAEHAVGAPGFAGAYFAGSITALAGAAEFPATSDIDVWVVHDEGSPSGEHGKLPYGGVTLDVAYVPLERLGSAEAILADYHVAGAFRSPNVIADPSGWLTALQAAVSKDFARWTWVLRRCEHARDHALRNARSLPRFDDFNDQAIAWLFANGIMTHVLLVAGLRNPTVRRRYAAVRELLEDYGQLAFHEVLLGSLGCREVGRERAERHLAALEDAFDAAKGVAAGAPLPFAANISDAARAIAVDGSRELIEAGLHREAVFWIAVTQARCQKLLHGAAPEAAARFEPAFRDLLADLGITSPGDLQRGAGQVEALLPDVWLVAAAIMATNPEIVE